MVLAFSDLVEEGRHSRKVLLFIVYVALFLDNMLLTTVVPIMPEYLYRMAHPNASLYGPESSTSMGPCPTTTPIPTLPTYPVDGDQYDNDVGPAPDVQETATTTPSSNKPLCVINVTFDKVADEKRREYMKRENIYVGLMFGSKALIQLMTNPFVGPMTNRIGYTIPMFFGFVVMFVSTLIFAFGTSYGILFIARTLQGIGSACTSSSGMGMLAQAYPDDQERGAVMGIALGGLALGVLVGPPFGGVLYELSGKELPFVILALLALFDGGLQLFVLKPRVVRGEQEGTSMKDLVKDPYIDVAAGAITIGNLGIAMLEPSLPLWMIEKMRAGSTMRGVAFLPASISYLIGTNIFGPLAHKIGRWLSTMLGLIIIGCCLLAIPSATSVAGLIAPNGFMGFAIGMIDASMFPQMGYLVDLRHVGVYGSIYAIADAAFCFAFALGPFFSGPIVKGLGFPAMLYIIAVINFAYAPLMLFLRNPPAMAQEKQQLISNNDNGAVRYEKFNEEYDGYQDRAEYDYDY